MIKTIISSLIAGAILLGIAWLILHIINTETTRNVANEKLQIKLDSIMEENLEYITERRSDILQISKQQDSITLILSIIKDLEESGGKFQYLMNIYWIDYQNLRDSVRGDGYSKYNYYQENDRAKFEVK
jgi:hypothetical protein